MRTGNPQLWDWVARFAERFEQVSVNRSSHPERGGAVRGRYGDNNTAHPIRCMRGSVFFWEMAELTGRESYRKTSLGIADFMTRSFPWTNARQAAAARDLVGRFHDNFVQFENYVGDEVKQAAPRAA